MKRMKKVLALCLAAAALFALSACGGKAGGGSAAPTASGQVLLENADVKITAGDISEDDGNAVLKVKIENRLDQTLWARAKWVTVNF